MLKIRITQIFMTTLMLTLFCTMIVGAAWLFDYKPKNLYFLWKCLGGILAFILILQFLFGAKIELK